MVERVRRGRAAPRCVAGVGHGDVGEQGVVAAGRVPLGGGMDGVEDRHGGRAGHRHHGDGRAARPICRRWRRRSGPVGCRRRKPGRSPRWPPRFPTPRSSWSRRPGSSPCGACRRSAAGWRPRRCSTKTIGIVGCTGAGMSGSGSTGTACGHLSFRGTPDELARLMDRDRPALRRHRGRRHPGRLVREPRRPPGRCAGRPGPARQRRTGRARQHDPCRGRLRRPDAGPHRGRRAVRDPRVSARSRSRWPAR